MCNNVHFKITRYSYVFLTFELTLIDLLVLSNYENWQRTKELTE